MAKLVKKSAEQEVEFLPNVLRIASIADSYKAIDLRALDVRGLTLIADCFLLCSASSEPQIKAIYNGVRDGLKEIGVGTLHVEGGFGDGWLILDYGTIVVHIFRKEARDFYDLDGLWGDAPLIDLQLDGE